MIAKLTGILDDISNNTLVLDVQGVGYLVHAGARTLASLAGVGQAACLNIETIVREDSITLYGFADKAEQFWFKTLTSVQGVGPKVGIALLSACTPEQLSLAIGAKDHTPLTRADGVGPKLAQRIVMELKDKPLSAPPVLVPSGPSPEVKQKSAKSAAKPSNTSHVDDAVSALINLGYARSEAYQAVNAAISAGQSDLSAIITAALKELAG